MSLRDPLAAVVIFALSAAFFFMSGAYRGGAEIFPRGVSAVMMIASALLFLRGLRGSSGGDRLEQGSAWRVAIVIVLTILYIIAVDDIGFVTSSVIFVPVTAYFLGIRNYLLIAVSSVVFVGLVAYLFRSIFQVPLPRELILTFF